MTGCGGLTIVRATLGVAMVSGALVLAMFAAGVEAAKPPTYAPKGCVKPRIKPRTIIVACGNGGFYFRVKHWSYWNGREAGGKAKVLINDCKPYCAVGTFRTYKAKVRLTKPRKRTCGGRKGVRMFQKVKFKWKTDPPSGVGRKYDLYCVP